MENEQKTVFGNFCKKLPLVKKMWDKFKNSRKSLQIMCLLFLGNLLTTICVNKIKMEAHLALSTMLFVWFCEQSQECFYFYLTEVNLLLHRQCSNNILFKI